MADNTPTPKPSPEPSKVAPLGRSPAYPAVPLSKAIELARRVWETQRKQEAHVQATMNALGYATASGSARRAIAALKQYGLTQESGEGDTRRIKLSEAALDVLLTEDNDPRRAKALRALALAPTINLALWERYGAHLPDDKSIIPFLIRDKGFNDEAAVQLLANYRETFGLAKLEAETDDSPHASSEIAANAKGGAVTAPKKPEADYIAPTPASMNPILSSTSLQELPILVGPGKVARIPFPMTEDDYELMMGTLTLWKKKIVTAIAAPTFPRRGTWKNKDNDQPVTVVGEWAADDGRIYFQVKESNSGIPKSEVTFDS